MIPEALQLPADIAASPAGRLNFRRTRRVLMTLDAVGGVWRYALDLAGALKPWNVEVVFAGFGPSPSEQQVAEAESVGRLVWHEAPLDWMVEDEKPLDRLPRLIAETADRFGVDLIQTNLPSQACGLTVPVPVVAMTHSCVVSWFRAVRNSAVPESWSWHIRRNLRGFLGADVVVAPSRAHARLTQACYGLPSQPVVVHNASASRTSVGRRFNHALAAGRWWDEGKNAAVLDAAAASARTPIEMVGPLNGPRGQSKALHGACYLGSLDNGRLRNLMARRTIFVSPSIYEPFGLAPLEAALSGAALVLSDIPTYRELWDGAADFVAPYDAAGFAAAIDGLAQDHRRRQHVAAAAGRRARDFGLARQAQAMLDVYDDAVRRRAGSSALAG